MTGKDSHQMNVRREEKGLETRRLEWKRGKQNGKDEKSARFFRME